MNPWLRPVCSIIHLKTCCAIGLLVGCDPKTSVACLLSHSLPSEKRLKWLKQPNSLRGASKTCKVSCSLFKLEPVKLKKRQSSVCSHCGGKYQCTKCRLRDAECYSCGKTGHIAEVCRSIKAPRHRSHSPLRSSQQEEATSLKANKSKRFIRSFTLRTKWLLLFKLL